MSPVGIPKDMQLLVSEADFKRLVEFPDEDPIVVAPIVYECKVIVAKWKGKECVITRSFKTKTACDDFLVELTKAKGKVIEGTVSRSELGVG